MNNGNENIDIITGCKKHDRKAQELLYKNYYRAMMSICLRYTRNDQDAVEVLNSGFLKVFLNIQRYDPQQGSLYTWIRTIVVNSCLDFNRQQQKADYAGEWNGEPEVSIAPEVWSKIKMDELLQLVRRLPPATQVVFNLYHIEGYNHKEIGQLLNISTGTSKWHLSEARKSLQQFLNEPRVKII